MGTGGCRVICQAPIQAFIHPAVWIPGIRNRHTFREKWIIEGSTVKRCLEDVTQVVVLFLLVITWHIQEMMLSSCTYFIMVG